MTALRIDNLSVTLAGRRILDGISIPALAHGQVVALLGRNAAGKSSLLKALSGEVPFSGDVRLGDKSLADRSNSRRYTGYLPQAPVQSSGLLGWELGVSTLRVGLAHHEDIERRVEEVFTRFALMEFAFRPTRELSVGKRQLLGLALMIARRPELLLLDEPTSALDLAWQHQALASIAEETRQHQTLSIVALHDVNLALRYCTQTIILDSGNLIACGPTQDVIREDIMEQIYGVHARLEQCSQGHPLIIVDQPVNPQEPRS